MSHQRNRDADRVIREERPIHHENSDRNRYSKVFRHTCRACAIYLMLCAIAVFILFIASVFDFFPVIATLAMFLAPHKK